MLSYKETTSWGFAIRELNPWIATSIMLVLALWLGQELWLREVYPVDEFKTFHRALDILAVAWGSYFTGYVFHLIVDFFPRMKDRYLLELAIEHKLSYLLMAHQSFLSNLMRNLDHDPTMDKSLYDTSPLRSKFGDDLAEAWLMEEEEEGALNHYTEIVGLIIELKEDRSSLDLDFRTAVDKAAKIAMNAYPIPPENEDQEAALERIETLSISIAPIFFYCHERTSSGRAVAYHLYDHVKSSNYVSAWEISRPSPFFAAGLSKTSSPLKSNATA